MSKSALDLTPVEAVACCSPLTVEALSVEQAEAVAPLLKALADPVRLRLLSLIAARDSEEACVCDLQGVFDLSQPTISHHLKVLHEVGLLDRSKRGVWVFYRVRREALADVVSLLGGGMTDLQRRHEGEDRGGAHRVRIEPMRPEHAERVLAIYRAGIDTGDATFETEPPTWEAFDRAKLTEHRFVAIDGGDVVGWVAVSPVSERCVYAGVVEHSVYVDPAARGRGVGRALLGALIASTEAAGIWTIQSGVFPENTASLALHRSLGFREVGVRERIGKRDGVWRDVVLLERRSTTS